MDKGKTNIKILGNRTNLVKRVTFEALNKNLKSISIMLKPGVKGLTPLRLFQKERQ